MADEPGGPAPGAPAQIIDLLIRFNPRTQEINVSGPIDNKILAFGMLEVAKETIVEYQKKQGERLVQPANFVLPKS